MSKKLFKETFEEIRGTVKKTGFSKSDFTKLMLAYINDPEFVADPDCKIANKGGEKVLLKKSIKPVKMFRNMLADMLIEMGIEKSEVYTFMDNYEFKKVDAMYDFMNNFIYYYMKTGRKYKLADKEDLVASIYLKGRDASEKVNKKGETVVQDAYYSLGQQSSCPKWKKGIKDDSGKVAKAFASILEEGDIE